VFALGRKTGSSFRIWKWRWV